MWNKPRTSQDIPYASKDVVEREVKGNLDYLKSEVDTNTTDIATNVSDIATNAADIADISAVTASWSQPARSKNTIYQNGDKVRIVTIAFYNDSGTSAAALLVKNTSPPTNEVCAYTRDSVNTLMGNFTAVIPANWYYKLNEATSTITVFKWTEVDLT